MCGIGEKRLELTFALSQPVERRVLRFELLSKRFTRLVVFRYLTSQRVLDRDGVRQLGDQPGFTIRQRGAFCSDGAGVALLELAPFDFRVRESGSGLVEWGFRAPTSEEDT